MKYGNDNFFILCIIWKIMYKFGFFINNYIFIWVNIVKFKYL